MFNISIDYSNVEIPEDTIGVDMGQTLSKVTYIEDNKIQLFSILNQTESYLIEEILESKLHQFSKINFTGGKGFELFQNYSTKVNSRLIDEFEANVRGVEVLYKIDKSKDLPSSLIVSIGTGTSMVLMKDSVQHLGGTAMGGGFFMGILKILFNLEDFEEVMNLAIQGNRYNLDLKVSDIYSPDDNRVSMLFREFTAATLGKIDLNFNCNYLQKEDFINSLICMMGENIGIIATLMAENNNVTNIVFCGGFLRGNKIGRKILSLICAVNKKKGIFLKNSEFSAAVGALVL
ncbi:MAG: hypothetical protein ACFFEN_16505 [Candidatus Thorarchaeota archaeon]